MININKIAAYSILTLGFYACTCLALALMNILNISNFKNILLDGFNVAIRAGVLFLAIHLIVKFRAKKKIA